MCLHLYQTMSATVTGKVRVYVEANLNTIQRGMKWSSLVDMLLYHIVVLCSHFVFTPISLDQCHRPAYLMYHVSDMIEEHEAWLPHETHKPGA